jgi:4-aminobutyrate aminotransferase-like enzyme
LAPCPQAATVSDFLRKNQSTFAKIIEPDPATAPAVYVDLSVASPLLSLIGTTGDSTTQLSRLIEQQIAAAGAEFGFGGYNEPRLVYAGPAFGSAEGPTAERRTVHLGLDLFLPAGAPVYAPLAGRVFAFHNNDARYDYGPVIMLEHHCDDGTPFYTLYGHLSPESLTGLHLGQPVAAGQRLGWLGAPPINGDWPPHLHFQIILDDLGQSYDYIGVARASQRSFWLGLSPDPNLIVGIPAERFPPSRPNKAETLANRRQRIGRSLSIAYQEPLKIVRGRRQYLYDETGRAYLDGVNNVCHVGHCHPQVAAAGQRQMATLNTNTRYLHDSINEFARRLCATLPEPLSVCFFVCSGSEANDLALRLARSYTGQFDMICVEAGYHGHTQALIDISPYKHNGPGGRGRPSWVQMATMPDPYRGAYKGYGEEAGRAYADDVRRAVNDIQRQGRGVAGFICESMIGCGGQIVLPAGYMAEAFRHVRAAGGLCIADEVQVGFGRVGTHFWGFQTQDVIPDIVSMGKPIGNGHPLAAVITTPAIAEAFANGMEYFSTFGGNPVSCEIGLAVLDVIEQEGLQANALAVGQRLMAGARGLMARYPLIGDVRGLGLYIGIELVLDRATLQPAGEHAAYISNRMKEYGVLVSTDGPYHNVLKIKPPIVWTDADADHCIATFERVLAEEALAV